MLIPQKEGDVTIPEISVSWFDTESGTYKRSKAGPFKITVTKGLGKKVERRRYLTKEKLNAVGNDIHFIKTDKPAIAQDREPYKKPYLFYMLITPWLLLLTLFVIKIKVRFFPSNTNRRSSRKALSIALKTLSKIEKKSLDESPSTVVERYLTSKIGDGVGSLTRNELVEKISSSGVSVENSQALANYLESVEMRRYTGGSSQSLAKEAIVILKKIEKEIK